MKVGALDGVVLDSWEDVVGTLCPYPNERRRLIAFVFFAFFLFSTSFKYTTGSVIITPGPIFFFTSPLLPSLMLGISQGRSLGLRDLISLMDESCQLLVARNHYIITISAPSDS